MSAAVDKVREAVAGTTDPVAGLRSPRWPAARAAWLRLHPTCAACGAPDHVEVHHVYPFSWPRGAATELDPTNFITLCEHSSRNCHLSLGHLGDWKARNPDVRADAAAYLAKVRARPYPPPDPS